MTTMTTAAAGGAGDASDEARLYVNLGRRTDPRRRSQSKKDSWPHPRRLVPACGRRHLLRNPRTTARVDDDPRRGSRCVGGRDPRPGSCWPSGRRASSWASRTLRRNSWSTRCRSRGLSRQWACCSWARLGTAGGWRGWGVEGERPRRGESAVLAGRLHLGRGRWRTSRISNSAARGPAVRVRYPP